MNTQFNNAERPKGCGTASDRSERFGQHGYGKFRNSRFGNSIRRPKYNVPVNIVDNETTFEVHVYAVGFAKENIQVTINEDVLSIKGTRSIDENNLPNFSTQEYPIKSFEREISLTAAVDKAAITASQKDGVLIITLPKTKESLVPKQEIIVS